MTTLFVWWLMGLPGAIIFWHGLKTEAGRKWQKCPTPIGCAGIIFGAFCGPVLTPISVLGWTVFHVSRWIESNKYSTHWLITPICGPKKKREK